MIYLGFIFFCFLALLSWMWGRHIDWMDKNHPEYKGEDFLNDKPTNRDDHTTGDKHN
jgi:hypothetical protein